MKIPKSMTRFIWIALGLALLAYAGYMLVAQLNDYSKASSLYENTVTEYVTAEPEKEMGEEKTSWEDLVDVNLSKLCEENKDIVGWIYFENEDISYPVLYSEDNSTYLRKTYTGETSSAGSIFMEAKNSKDFSDAHTIIYGHNMKDLSMFGRLKYYVTDKDYITDHSYFQIITEKGKFRYKIISYKEVADDSRVYTIYKDGDQDFLTFVKETIQSGSYYNAEENISCNDQLITLSTCLNDDRLVVTALRCDEKE